MTDAERPSHRALLDARTDQECMTRWQPIVYRDRELYCHLCLGRLTEFYELPDGRFIAVCLPCQCITTLRRSRAEERQLYEAVKAYLALTGPVSDPSEDS